MFWNAVSSHFYTRLNSADIFFDIREDDVDKPDFEPTFAGLNDKRPILWSR